MTYRKAWDYIYGRKSHMNLAGKLLLGVPMFPYVFVFITVWILLDALFSKKGKA